MVFPPSDFVRETVIGPSPSSSVFNTGTDVTKRYRFTFGSSVKQESRWLNWWKKFKWKNKNKSKFSYHRWWLLLLTVFGASLVLLEPCALLRFFQPLFAMVQLIQPMLWMFSLEPVQQELLRFVCILHQLQKLKFFRPNIS